ncbi:helix-turn-helix domain-containing protein [Streptomyces yaizuensis]|uniref:Helix-turn-helix transcriptional regulator n=1 Tax=Streptomyces yaizuensis TaxID=2989713 RepID=A0ABQ5PAD3_9ACTN|nr:helix-turn-helix transcriptional regulator [Streptomyces sp. YSPA8]GLF99455.1 helix-turn-helix transcriptional regulator [Streptomyces sp. YSPA8]
MEIDRVVGGRLEKARRRKGWHQGELGAAVGRSESWVSQIERGVASLDSVAMAERLARIVRLEVEFLLAFDVRYSAGPKATRPVRSSGPVAGSSVDAPPDAEGYGVVLRRVFTLGSLAGLTTAVTGLSPDAHAQIGRASGHGVDRAAAEELRAIGAAYRRSYRSFPASSLVTVAHHQVQLVLSLRPKDQPVGVRESLLAHLAEMAALAGALLAIDLGDPELAEGYLDLGYQVAKETGSAEIRALILAGRAFPAAFGGDGESALDYALAAVDTAGRGASVRMRAWTSAVASEMYASTGDEHGFRTSLEEARRVVSGPVDDERWGGIGAFDLAKADAYEGSDLVRLGRFAEALPALDGAIGRLPAEMVRHRCSAFVSRAEAYAGAGEVEAACADGHAALDLAEHVQHQETLRRVSALHRGLRPRGTAGARALGEHLVDVRTVMRSATRRLV